jgi:hypothetical protein
MTAEEVWIYHRQLLIEHSSMPRELRCDAASEPESPIEENELATLWRNAIVVNQRPPCVVIGLPPPAITHSNQSQLVRPPQLSAEEQQDDAGLSKLVIDQHSIRNGTERRTELTARVESGDQTITHAQAARS